MKENLSIAAAILAASLGCEEGCTLAHLSPKTQNERKEEIGKVLRSLGAVDTGTQPDGGEVQCIIYREEILESSMDTEIREMQLCANAKLKMIEKSCSSSVKSDKNETSIETKGAVYGSSCNLKETKYDDRVGLACIKVSKPDRIECN